MSARAYYWLYAEFEDRTAGSAADEMTFSIYLGSSPISDHDLSAR